MPELTSAQTPPRQWIERCAQRLLQHRIVTPGEAAQLARELHASIGGEGCPERVADDLFRIPAET